MPARSLSLRLFVELLSGELLESVYVRTRRKSTRETYSNVLQIAINVINKSVITYWRLLFYLCT